MASQAEARFTAAMQRLTNALATVQAALTEMAQAHADLKAEQEEVGRAVKQLVERVPPSG